MLDDVLARASFVLSAKVLELQFQCKVKENMIGRDVVRLCTGIAAVEFFFDLALKLRIKHLGREHKAGAGKHIVGHELDPLGQQAVQFDKVFHGLEQAIAQAAFVRATGHGGDQIDVAFAQHGPLFGKGQAPRRAFALGEAVVLGIGKACAFEQGQQGVGGQRLF